MERLNAGADREHLGLDRQPVSETDEQYGEAQIPKATDADADAHHIPPSCCLENWDPTKFPILLLGNVFDAWSLGRWIFDSTVYYHGPGMPISGVAGELWPWLTTLHGNVRRAEEGLDGIRVTADREVVAGFVEAGEKLMATFGELLRACEGPMLKVLSGEGREAVLVRWRCLSL